MREGREKRRKREEKKKKARALSLLHFFFFRRRVGVQSFNKMAATSLQLPDIAGEQPQGSPLLDYCKIEIMRDEASLMTKVLGHISALDDKPLSEVKHFFFFFFHFFFSRPPPPPPQSKKKRKKKNLTFFAFHPHKKNKIHAGQDVARAGHPRRARPERVRRGQGKSAAPALDVENPARPRRERRARQGRRRRQRKVSPPRRDPRGPEARIQARGLGTSDRRELLFFREPRGHPPREGPGNDEEERTDFLQSGEFFLFFFFLFSFPFLFSFFFFFSRSLFYSTIFIITLFLTKALRLCPPIDF